MRASDLDDALSSPARIAIMAALLPGQALSFTVLKRATGLADGNLHVQARKLAAAECLIIRKQPHGKRTRTTFCITDLGGLRFRRYVGELQAVLAREDLGIEPTPAGRRSDDAQVW